jgi:hypothetical protein
MKPTITDDLKAILKRNSWQLSGNNIHNLPGFEILSTGPGALQPKEWNQSVRFIGTGFVVLQTTCTWPNGPLAPAVFVHDVVAAVQTEADLVAWLEANGKRSEGGQ